MILLKVEGENLGSKVNLAYFRSYGAQLWEIQNVWVSNSIDCIEALGISFFSIRTYCGGLKSLIEIFVTDQQGASISSRQRVTRSWPSRLGVGTRGPRSV